MLGIDIVKISRVEKIYNKYGDRFLNRILNKEEMEYLSKKNFSIKTLAGLYSSKESMSKALGTGIGKVSFRDLKIVHNNSKPEGFYKNMSFDLSISHDGEYAISICKLKDEYKKEFLFNKFLKREDNFNKYDLGRVAIVGGSKGMCGSIYLSSIAALRSGSGLVYNYVANDIFDIMCIKHNEVIVREISKETIKDLKKMNAVAFGPGIKEDSNNLDLLKNLIYNELPIVIDATGLKILSENLNLLKCDNKNLILTPHEYEFSRLVKKSVEVIKENREKYAKEFAKKYGITLVLKGKHTIVTNGDEIYINDTGNSGMATAGSGDVLTGIITSFLGRGINSFIASKMGVYVHGLAGDVSMEKKSKETLIASDLIDSLSSIL